MNCNDFMCAKFSFHSFWVWGMWFRVESFIQFPVGFWFGTNLLAKFDAVLGTHRSICCHAYRISVHADIRTNCGGCFDWCSRGHGHCNRMLDIWELSRASPELHMAYRGARNTDKRYEFEILILFFFVQEKSNEVENLKHIFRQTDNFACNRRP